MFVPPFILAIVSGIYFRFPVFPPDLIIEPWAEVDNEKRRSVKYTINLNLTIGPKNSKIEEKQVRVRKNC